MREEIKLNRKYKKFGKALGLSKKDFIKITAIANLLSDEEIDLGDAVEFIWNTKNLKDNEVIFLLVFCGFMLASHNPDMFKI